MGPPPSRALTPSVRVFRGIVGAGDIIPSRLKLNIKPPLKLNLRAASIPKALIAGIPRYLKLNIPNTRS